MHSHDSNFHINCGIDGCVRTYSNYHSFRKHILRQHRNTLNASIEEPVVNTVESTNGLIHNLTEDDHVVLPTAPDIFEFTNTVQSEDFVHNSALFLLKAREVHKVSQSALNNIILDISVLNAVGLSAMKEKVLDVLTKNGIDVSKIAGLDDVFTNSYLNDPFSGLTTEYLQNKYYEESLFLVVCEI